MMTATTPTDRDAFEAALNVSPDDWSLRLVYADWLDEHEAEVPCGNCYGDGQVWHERDWDSHWDCPDCNGTGRVSNGFADLARTQRWMSVNRKRPNKDEVSFRGRQWQWCWQGFGTHYYVVTDDYSSPICHSFNEQTDREFGDTNWMWPTRVAAERALAEALKAAGES